ncbi:MAG: DUF1622 domain-containing protein [Marinifilaceae bacterium]
MLVEWYKEILNTTAEIISAVSLVIVVYGTLIGFIAFARNEVNRLNGSFNLVNIRRIRVECGSYLLLGLEFLIASDILETVLKPGFDELAILGGIVVVRIVLSYFLNKEMKELKEEDGSTENK